MTKLTTDTNRVYELGDINEFPVLGGELIYQGAAVGLEVASGYVRDLQVGDKFLGLPKIISMQPILPMEKKILELKEEEMSL